jgi:hypothetical protein
MKCDIYKPGVKGKINIYIMNLEEYKGAVVAYFKAQSRYQY